MCQRIFIHSSLLFVNHCSILPDSPTEKVAELSYVATLEDLGFVKAKEVILSQSQVRRARLHTKLRTALPLRCLSHVFYALVFVSLFIYCLFRMKLWVPHSYHLTQQQADLLLPHWNLPPWPPQPQFYPETPWSTVQLWSWNGGKKSRRICLTVRWK